MSRHTRSQIVTSIGAAMFSALVAGACTDSTVVDPPSRPQAAVPSLDAIHFWDAGATAAWNAVARALTNKYPASPQVGVRLLAYLSLAQYDAVIGAEQGSANGEHPSPQAAVAGASAVVLANQYPAEAAALEALVDAQASAPTWPGEKHTDFASGEAIGRTIGARVLASEASDGFTAALGGPVPVCPGCWFSATPPLFPRLAEMRPFFLTSASQFRPAPPPAFGSPAFLAALAEVRQIADTRTPEQDAIAKFWAAPPGYALPQSYINQLATDLIADFRLDERRAAHALAIANMAAMDAFIACHEAKYTYWLLRPSMADPGIKLAIGLPNHPSYPSNHACVTGATMAVLGALFPSRADYLWGLAEQAGISRVYGGIHYRFDMNAGLTLARQTAAWALAHDVNGHEPLPIR
jgi:membrane-associated phospholipid phosphatase